MKTRTDCAAIRLRSPGKVTFVFKNVGHVQHDFKINRKVTPLLRPGKTARLVVTFKKKGKYPISAPCLESCCGDEGRLHGSLSDAPIGSVDRSKGDTRATTSRSSIRPKQPSQAGAKVTAARATVAWTSTWV